MSHSDSVQKGRRFTTGLGMVGWVPGPISSPPPSDDVGEQNSWAALWAGLTGHRTWPTKLTGRGGGGFSRAQRLGWLIDILFLPKKEKILFVPSALEPEERRRRRRRGRRRRSAALLSTRWRRASREGILP
jgi:hypothetical protein